MSNFLSRYNLSVEEEQKVVVPHVSGSDGVDVSTVIENGEVDEQLAETESAIKADVLAIEQGEDAICELEAQIDNNEQMIAENPTEVTENTVAMATEAYYVTMGALGYKKSEVKVSFESNLNPVEKLSSHNNVLRVSVEEVRSIVGRIRDLLAKRIEIYNKLFLRKVDGNKELILSLKSKVQGLDNSYKADDDRVNNEIFRLGVFVAANDGKFDIAKFKSYVSSAVNNPAVEVLNTFLDQGVKYSGQGENELEKIKKELPVTIANLKVSKDPFNAKVTEYVTSKVKTPMISAIAITTNDHVAGLGVNVARTTGIIGTIAMNYFKLSTITAIFAKLIAGLIAMAVVGGAVEGGLIWLIHRIISRTHSVIGPVNASVSAHDIKVSNTFNKAQLLQICNELEKLSNDAGTYVKKLSDSTYSLEKVADSKRAYFFDGKDMSVNDKVRHGQILTKAAGDGYDYHVHLLNQYKNFIINTTRFVNKLV